MVGDIRKHHRQMNEQRQYKRREKCNLPCMFHLRSAVLKKFPGGLHPSVTPSFRLSQRFDRHLIPSFSTIQRPIRKRNIFICKYFMALNSYLNNLR